MNTLVDTISGARRALDSGDLRSTDLVAAVMSSAERLNPSLNAVVSTLDTAIPAAEKADAERAAGRTLGPLHGIPIGVKENIDVAGEVASSGSQVLAGRVADADATVVAALRRAGAIPVAMLSMHEFAHGVTSNSPWFGATRNAWDQQRTAGGSSGGSASAVAAGIVPGSLGTDTGGSVRIPAALNGLVGLRPGIGRVSNKGILPLAWSMDTCGPLARTAEDASLILEAITGGSYKHWESPGVAATGRVLESLSGTRIGVLPDLDDESLQPDVLEAMAAAKATLRAAGAEFVDLTVEGIGLAHSAMMVVDVAEPSAVHERWIHDRGHEYAPDIRALILAGQTISAVEYLQAQRARQFLAASFMKAFNAVDAILTPTIGFTAPIVGQTVITLKSGREETLIAAALRYTAYASATGLPAVSVPCGISQEGLPIGMQLIGARNNEGQLLQIAAQYQAVTEWHTQRPQRPAGIDARLRQ